MAQTRRESWRKRPFATGRSVLALVLREMSTAFGRSMGGYLWAILEPAAGIALLTMAFSLVFRAPPIGNSFPVFYATGLLPFLLYTDIAGKVAQSIRFSRQLLFYPRLTFVDAIIARFLLNFFTQIMVFAILMTGLLAFNHGAVIVDLPAVILALVMAASLALGIGTINCYLFLSFPSWERIWMILNRPMFLISGIFFTFESVPREYREYLWFNPLVHVIGQSRSGFFPTYEAAYVSATYVFAIALISLTTGLLLLNRSHRDLVNS